MISLIKDIPTNKIVGFLIILAFAILFASIGYSAIKNGEASLRSFSVKREENYFIFAFITFIYLFASLVAFAVLILSLLGWLK